MNYVLCGNETFLNCHYAYIDCNKYLADNIFINNNIKVKYKKELKLNEKYKIIFVNVYFNKDYLFVKSMIELQEKMYNLGYEDYEETCNKIISKISKSKKKVKKWKI